MKRRRPQKKNIFLILALALFFFFLALFLYKFQNLFPHFVSDSKIILRPDSIKKDYSDLARALKDNNVDFDSIKEASQSSAVIVSLKDGSFAYLTRSMDFVSQVKILSGILSRISIENPNKKLRYIDLRFDKAVIKF